MEVQPINHTEALEPQKYSYQPWPNHADNDGLVWKYLKQMLRIERDEEGMILNYEIHETARYLYARNEAQLGNSIANDHAVGK
jgi:hypothetical protein